MSAAAEILAGFPSLDEEDYKLLIQAVLDWVFRKR